MSSTLVLISLMLALSVAVVFPEIQFSKKNVTISNEYQFMVDKQRKGFMLLGLIALTSFFIALQTLSVGIFIFHLMTDAFFGVYAYTAFQVRSSSMQRKRFNNIVESVEDEENVVYLKQAV